MSSSGPKVITMESSSCGSVRFKLFNCMFSTTQLLFFICLLFIVALVQWEWQCVWIVSIPARSDFVSHALCVFSSSEAIPLIRHTMIPVLEILYSTGTPDGSIGHHQPRVGQSSVDVSSDVDWTPSDWTKPTDTFPKIPWFWGKAHYW